MQLNRKIVVEELRLWFKEKIKRQSSQELKKKKNSSQQNWLRMLINLSNMYEL